MESIYTEFALYGSKNECPRTENVCLPYLRSAMVPFPFYNANVWLHVTHTGLFLMGVLVAVIFFLNFN